ncbi:MAG: PQQ-binding-like beta-propeller repeat protein [Pirellula sp.]|jgi:outer membrane protein assembly factor BamB
MKSHLFILSILTFSWFVSNLVFANEDWPQWRFDSQRRAASNNRLPTEFSVLWEKRYTARVQAWDDPLNQDLMTFDKNFEPIALNGKLFVPFNEECKLVALDIQSGKSLWTFYAEGPIRFAPAGWKDKLFVVSDDGFLYCLSEADGSVLWKYSPAPSTQKVIGNRRVISAWPARGGPTVRDNTVYFASSIWPFMGTFICALDAETGTIKWMNDSTGSQYIKQPHSAPAFAGVAPQGFLVATEKHLVVPGGRSVPAVFDRATGQLKYFEINAGGKGTGGAFVAADNTHFYVHTRQKGTRAFDLETGLKTAFLPNEPVIAEKLVYSAEIENEKPIIRVYAANQPVDTKRDVLGEIAANGTRDLILVQDHLVAVGPRTIEVIKLESDAAGLATRGIVVRTIETRFPTARIIVASNTLVAVDEFGGLTAYGVLSEENVQLVADDPNRVIPELTSERLSPSLLTERQKLYGILSQCDAQGYAYWYGDCSQEQFAALCDVNPFEQWCVVLPADRNPADLHDHLDRMQHRSKVTLFCAHPEQFRAPQFTGNLVVVAETWIEKNGVETLRKIYETVRPYGGAMVVLCRPNADKTAIAASLQSLQLEQSEVKIHSDGIVVYRMGKLPGSADWTHQYGDIANSIKSNDSRVKLPLGVLWFGASSNLDVLPRHGHGPPEQVVGGRLFIEGMNSLSARDVYTGRVLWKRNFENLGTYDVYYDATYENTPLDPKYNQVHIPGANGRGTNYVVTEERIYLVVGDTCKLIDPQTGNDIGEIRLPPNADGSTSEWGYLGVYKDVLIGGVGFAKYRDRYGLEFDADKELKPSKAGFGAKSLDRAASVGLVGFNRFTGELLWRTDAKHSFWHNGIVAGDNKIFCLDRNPQRIEEAMKRRGLELPTTYRLLAIDYRTGSPIWEYKDKIFGTWLGYSEKHNMLLQAGASASDRLVDEVGQGMAVYDAASGNVVWSKETLKYSGPCVLHNDLIITNTNSYSESAGAFFIRTGEQKMTKNPLTNQYEPWKMTRAYGCNSIIASENLLTFRSGAAGYYDLNSESGTGNFGGFRSGCTANLVVANGVLNAPDYTRTCSCSYQNQTSLALVHIPDVELWSVYPDVNSKLDLRTANVLNINFGAPGDRRASDGSLWVEYPNESGDPLAMSIEFNPEAKLFRHHSSRYADSEFPWLVSSGVEGVSKINISLNPPVAVDTKEAGKDDKSTASGTDKAVVKEPRPPVAPRVYDVELLLSFPKSQESTNQSYKVTIEGQPKSEEILVGGSGEIEDSLQACVIKGVSIGDECAISISGGPSMPVISGMRLLRVVE